MRMRARIFHSFDQSRTSESSAPPVTVQRAPHGPSVLSRGENCRLHAQRQRLQEWRSCPKGAQHSAAPSLLCPPVLWTSLSRIRDEREGERPAHIEKTSSPLESNFNRFAAPLPLPLPPFSIPLSFVFRVPPPLPPSLSRPAAALRGSPTPSRDRLRDEPAVIAQPRDANRGTGPHVRVRPSVWPRRRHRQTVGLRG